MLLSLRRGGLWVPVPALLLPGRPRLPIQEVATPAVAAPLWLTPLLCVSPLQSPWGSLLYRSPVILCLGGCPARRPPWRTSQESLPGWARARPSWPPVSLVDNGPFHISSEEARQNNPTPAPSSLSCAPCILSFAMRGFPALSVTPGQLEQPHSSGLRPGGVRPQPKAGLQGQFSRP